MTLNNKILEAINTGVQNVLNEKFGVIDAVNDIFDIFYQKYTDLINNANNSNISLSQLPDISIDYEINGILHTFIFEQRVKTDAPASYIVSPVGATVHKIEYDQSQISRITKDDESFVKEIFCHEIRHALDGARRVKNAYAKKGESLIDINDKQIYQSMAKFKRTVIYSMYEHICNIEHLVGPDFKNACKTLWIFEPTEHTAILQSLPVTLDSIYKKVDNSPLYQTIISYYLRRFANMIASGKGHSQLDNNTKYFISSIGYINCITSYRSFNHILNLIACYYNTEKPIDYYILDDKKIMFNNYNLFYHLSMLLCLKYNYNVNDSYKYYKKAVEIEKTPLLNNYGAYTQLKKFYDENVSDKLNKKVHNYFEKYFNSVNKIICDFLYKYPFKKYIVETQEEYNRIMKLKMSDMFGHEDLYEDELLCDYIDMDGIFDLSKIQ